VRVERFVGNRRVRSLFILGAATDGGNDRVPENCGPMLQLLAVSLAIMSSAVFAQGEPHMGSPQQQRACRVDALRHCQGVHEDIAIADCLKANAPKLHLACRQSLRAAIVDSR
jgi:hypothetical protein